MKLWVFRVLAVVVALTLEIRVKASGPSAEPAGRRSVLERPHGCLSDVGECALWVREKRWIFAEANSTVAAAFDTLLVRLGQGHWRLLDGSLYLKATTPTRLETHFGVVEIPAGRAILRSTRSELSVYSLDDGLEIRGASGAIAVLPAGFSVRVMGVGRSGQVSEIPQAIGLAELIRLWAPLFPGDRETLRTELASLKPVLVEAAENGSRWHQDLIHRRLASLAEDERRAREAVARREAENRELRALFRRKNLID